MSPNPELPMTEPGGSSPSMNLSSASASVGMAAPSDLVVESGSSTIETIENPSQFAHYPATADVPILRSPPLELHHTRTQLSPHPQSELQAQPDTALNIPGYQSMSVLSAACGSNAEPFNAQHLDRQRAVSMQPLDRDSMRAMHLSAPLPGLNLFMSRMADNQNNWSAGLSQGQRALSQQPTSQSFEFLSTDNPVHRPTLVYDQSGQLVSMGHRAANQQVLSDVPSTDIKNSSPPQLVMSATIAHSSPLVHVGDQTALDQRAMGLHTPSASGHVGWVGSPDQQLSQGQFQYAGVPGVGHCAHRSAPLLPPPGLPATGGFIWPDCQGEQVSNVQQQLRNNVTSTVSNDFSDVATTSVASSVPNTLLKHDISRTVSSASQQPQLAAREQEIGSPTAGHKPIFGFASLSEAENFQHLPRKLAGDRPTHGLPSIEQSQESPPSARKKIVFGFPPRSQVKQEKTERVSFPSLFGIFPAKTDEPTDMTPNVWNPFGPYSACLAEQQEMFGRSTGSNNERSAQVSMGTSSLEPGETVDPNRYRNLDGSPGDSLSPGSSPEPLRVESLAVNHLSSHQVFFIFQVVSVMAHLRPEFVFRRGEDESIGAKLTLWGHTVVIDPSANNVTEAKVAACRRALELIQESNPDWLVPPQPIDGPTTPDWNWIWMLVDYCEERGWHVPLYRPSSNGNLWHCDISAKDKIFRTVRQCKSLGEAQNTAAHTALYQLMVIEESDDCISNPFPTLSAVATATGRAAAAPAPVSASIQKQCAQRLRSVKNPPKKGASRPAQYAGVTKPPASSFVQSRRARKKFNRQTGSEDKTQLNRSQPEPSLPPPGPLGVARASNMIPVVKSRLAPMAVTSQKVEDPLAMLKKIEKDLKQLSNRASFRRIMEKICDVLGANYPKITRQKNPDKDLNVCEVLATFDSSHPYLSRASPINLADVDNPDPEIAEEIAVKHVILHMLKMVKEDADISDDVYKKELGALYKLEGETEDCLDRQSRSSGLRSF